MQIKPNCVVSITYDLYVNDTNEEKAFVESATQQTPLVFLYGVGSMIPKFEENLLELSVGDSYSFSIEPEHGYGIYDENAQVGLSIAMFDKNTLPNVGDVLPLKDNQGNEFRGTVVELTEQEVIVDLNHPMAGKTLHFNGEILEIREATPEELAHGHVHGEGGHQH